MPIKGLTCGGDPDQHVDSGSLVHFLHCCGIGNIWTFLIRSTTDFTILGEMTDADKVMHPQHFGTDPADIRIWINTVWNPR